MSVRPITGEELANLYGNLALRQRVLDFAGVKEDELKELLLTVQVTNRAACCITYGHELKAEALEFTGEVTKRLSDRELFELLGNLEYNCISNGGKLFLRQKQWQMLNGLQLTVAWVHFEDDAAQRGTRASEGEEEVSV